MHTFVPGERVVFAESSGPGDPIINAVKEHGGGPFTITFVEDVPVN